MADLYDNSLVDHVTGLFVEVCQLCSCQDDRVDNKAAVISMTTLIELLHDILKYLSEIVRKALQVRNTSYDVIDSSHHTL